MITIRRALAALLVATLAPLALVVSSGAAAVPATVAVGTPGAVGPGSVVLGAVAPSTPLALTVVLAPRDPAGLAALAAAVATPGSPEYHHYLTVGQFAQRFGASPSSVAAVGSELRATGLQPGALAADGLSLSASGDASAASATFGVNLRRYRQRDGENVFANSAAPHVPASLAGVVSGVLGLDDAPVAAPTALSARRARVLTTHDAEEPLTSGPAPTQGCTLYGEEPFRGPYTINQVADAYGMGSLYADDDFGTGVTVALFELESHTANDISTFQTCFGTDATVNTIAEDGGPGAPSGSDPGLESDLDIENVIGISPTSTVDVYEGPNNNQGVYKTLQAIVTSGAQVASDSWGLCESQTSATVYNEENTLLQEAATAGQSVLVAAGDAGSAGCSGSSTLAVDDPASQPFATGVGGTKLASTSSPSTQTVWNDANGAGGGGVSTLWPMPSWQTALGVNGDSSKTVCEGSAAYTAGSWCREVPDVSADAAPSTGYIVYYSNAGADAGYYDVGGTSAAAPVWAGMTALADASSVGGCTPATPLGFLNPELYAIAAGSGYGDAFDDIASGNNDTSGSGDYPATTGYDMASGLGTPIATDGSSPGLVTQLCDALGGGSGGSGGSGSSGPTPPTVSGVSQAEAAPGATVTVAGTGFAAGATVEFGSAAATAVSVVSSTALSATVPAGSGTVDVTVTTTNGTSSTGAADHFTYAPTETITTPAVGATYTQGESVRASYGCAASAPGAVTCMAPTAPGAAIDTNALGPKQFTVTATDANGVSTSTTVAFTVVAPPTVSITTPAQGAVYLKGRAVLAAYGCTTTAPVAIASCAGTVAAGAALDTATPGVHFFTVTAADSNGVSTQASVAFTVIAATATLTAAAPTISDVRESATRWREHAARGSQIPVGTTFSFTLDRAATVTFSFTTRAGGRLRGGHCVARSAATRRARTCLRTVAFGRMSVSAAAGAGRVPFAGHTSAGTLPPGSYTVTIIASSAAGKVSATTTLHFTVAGSPQG